MLMSGLHLSDLNKETTYLLTSNTAQIQSGSEPLPNSRSAHKVKFTAQTWNKKEM